MQTDKISSIWAIATLPEYRRKWYATKILKDLLSETTKPSFLTVAKGHKEAEDAYNKAWFRAKFDLNWYTKRGS